MSPSVSLSFALLLPLLMSMCSASPFNNFLVSTVSETTTVTTTSTSTFVCAELVNATTACNARNGRWLHVPEILTFDESIDIVDHYINPSVPYRIIPTVYHAPIPRMPMIESGHNNIYSPYPIQERFFFGSFFNNIGATVTRRFTSTSTVVTTISGTFFISKCTPSPFPFTLC